MRTRSGSKPDTSALERFMRRRSLSRKAAGQALGVSERMIYWYLNGKHAIPQSIHLLIRALEAQAK